MRRTACGSWPTCGMSFGADKLWTETILAALHGIPEAPWGNWLEHPLHHRELAKLLKPYASGPVT